MKLTGKLEWYDMGAGAWTLVTDRGQRYALLGEVPEALDGKRVVVDGAPADAMGTAMPGAGVVEVRRIVRA